MSERQRERSVCMCVGERECESVSEKLKAAKKRVYAVTLKLADL